MKKLLTGLILIYSVFVFAGKDERDFQSATGEPAVKKAEKSFKDTCGGALKITVPWDKLNLNQMKSVRDTAEAISGGVAAYCTNEGNKKAMKALTSIVFTEKGTSSFSFKNGVGTIAAEANSYIPFDSITKEVDK
ncbi:MAG: hypothetical protein L6Q37_06795 [Bdellovibrionaceae bacterium]|nr:hypothetical protein [Bacteriovoracaceae bacterium]MCK6598055.1 hypothetical protein [Pseudobdellovibrionaceae bacterium]NUM58997.1 hypothetical protein [Pseudobdellovibrionaceae bacterium]